MPERPTGISRNVVITEWEWSDPTAYLHDEISTDRWDPSVNAKGKLYGSAEERPTTCRCSTRPPMPTAK